MMNEIHLPDKLRFDERKLFVITFLDLDAFQAFVKEFHYQRLSPFFEMPGTMTDQFGFTKYKEGAVERVVYVLVDQLILIRCILLKKEGVKDE